MISCPLNLQEIQNKNSCWFYAGFLVIFNSLGWWLGIFSSLLGWYGIGCGSVHLDLLCWPFLCFLFAILWIVWWPVCILQLSVLVVSLHTPCQWGLFGCPLWCWVFVVLVLSVWHICVSRWRRTPSHVLHTVHLRQGPALFVPKMVQSRRWPDIDICPFWGPNRANIDVLGLRGLKIPKSRPRKRGFFRHRYPLRPAVHPKWFFLAG